MTKLLTICAALLCVASLCLAQSAGYQSSSVVVGQTPDGHSRIISVIPLKFLDAGVAARLFGGLGFSGSAFGLPTAGGGEYDSTRSSGQRQWGSRNQSGNLGNTGGYGGYGQALQQGVQSPGYQSPYGNR